MTTFDEPIFRILRSLGPIHLDTFSARLKLQKLAYLAQEMGAGKKYSYSWYVYGPYSSSLTSVLYLGVELGRFDSEPNLTKDEAEIVSKLKQLLDENISNPSKLEIFASVWYLLPTTRIASKKDQDTIIEIMHKKKPHFKDSDVRNALDIILNFRDTHSIIDPMCIPHFER